MNVSPAQVRQRRTNNARIAAERAAATHCKRGHALTPKNTYNQPGDSRRRCLTCKQDRDWYRHHGLGMIA